MHLPKRLMVAYAIDPPTAVMSSKSSPHQQCPLESPGNIDKFARRNVNSVKSKTDIANDEKKGVTNDVARSIP